VSAVAGLRVLQLGPVYVSHTRRWAQHAAALGASVHVAGHVRAGRQALDFGGVAEHVDVLPVERVGVESELAWLDEVLRRVAPDVVHAHWLPRWAHRAVCSGHPAVVVTAWGSDVYLATGDDRARADEALRGAAHVLAPSPHMLDAVRARGAPNGRSHHVELGVDVERFRPADAAQRARARDELGLPGAGPIVLSVRAPGELYNLDVVVDGFRRLREQVPAATLVLAHGAAELPPALGDAVRAVGGIVAGDVAYADMPRYVRAATVGVSIPSSDGSPNSVWEALACGVPMVVSDLPQIRARVAASDGLSLVAPRADAVALALREIVTDAPRHARMAAAGRTWAQANVDDREQLARLGAVYAATSRSADRPGSAPAPAWSRSQGGAAAPGRARGTASAAGSRPRPS
jgi:glycosyltransferase involved in cell wall biosynthesis